MAWILPPEQALPPISRSPRGLSRRRVKASIAIGQRWTDRDGYGWRVVNIYRKDGLVLLQGPAVVAFSRRYVSFGQLGKSYRLAEEP